MKKLKLFSLITATVLFVALMTLSAFAASATISLTASSSNVTVGNQVRVTVKITGSENIGSWLFSLQYDPSYLEYVSGADSGGGGAVSFSDAPATPSATISKTVVFKTKKIGSTTVSVSNPQVVSFDSLTSMSAGNASRTIKISAAPTLSGDHALSNLSVSAGELSPAFSAETTEYFVNVPFEVRKLDVGATAKHSAASVTVSDTALNVGENQITVTVTAQNGKTKTYTIKVNRAQSELFGVTAQVNGQDFTVAHDPTTLTIPEGYTEKTAMLGEQKILVYASPLDSIQIAYLVAASESAASGWYIFREAEQTFVPYTPIPVAPSTFVILNPPVGENAPFGFIPTTMTVGEMTVEAYQSEGSAESDIYLVYAMAQDGNCNYYFYDSKNVSFSSYFAHSVEPEENSELVNAQVSGRLEEIRAIADRMEILSLILALVIVFMGIGMVLLLAFYRRAPKGKRKKKTESVDPMGELLLVENEFNRDAKENISIDKIYETEQKKD